MFSETGERPSGSLADVLPEVTVYLPVGELIDIPKEIGRLEGELEKIEANMQRCENKLANEGFLNNAPEEVVEKERKRREEHSKRKEKIEATLDNLRSV